MFKRISVLAATLGAVALLGASLAGSAFAQGPNPSTDPAQPQAGFGGRWGASQTAGSTMRGPAWGGQATLGVVSDLTGKSVADIQAERQDGKSLLEIAKVAKDDLVNKILAAKKAVVDGLVKAGTLTQDQADTMLDNMAERVSTAVERTETGPANGRERWQRWQRDLPDGRHGHPGHGASERRRTHGPRGRHGRTVPGSGGAVTGRIHRDQTQPVPVKWGEANASPLFCVRRAALFTSASAPYRRLIWPCYTPW